ncbi:MAG: TolC family protein [Chryseosolibacter sp.]
MKALLTSALSFFVVFFGAGQNTLTIERCYALAEANYPLSAQRDLIQKTKDLSIENASKGHLPQISLAGQATYQSDVTRIPLEMPGIQPLSKDQYRVFGEISQNLYHGGLIKQQEEAEEISGAIDAGKLDVDLYQLRNRINDLFFGIVLLQEQRAQRELVKQDLVAALGKVEGSIRYGTALRSAADVLNAESLHVDQGIIELESAEASYREMLGLFIGEPVLSSTLLAKPDWSMTDETIARPELRLFDLQKQDIEANRAMVAARKKPRIDLFLQGGYGRPALNMLDNSFDTYYLGGVRFTWQLSGYYTFRREKEVLDLRQQSLGVQEETFLFNTNLTSRQHHAEIAKLQRLLAVDDEIISLRRRVQETASAQLEEGVIPATDYVREVNATGQARQNRVLHEAQLLMAQARYRFTNGNE